MQFEEHRSCQEPTTGPRITQRRPEQFVKLVFNQEMGLPSKTRKSCRTVVPMRLLHAHGHWPITMATSPLCKSASNVAWMGPSRLCYMDVVAVEFEWMLSAGCSTAEWMWWHC